MCEREARKKHEEKVFLEGFLRSFDLDAGIIEADRESPDFMLKYKDQIIGVEVTKVYISDERGAATLQAREARTSKIISKAQKIYQTYDRPPVLVQVVFHPGYDLTTLPIEPTANTLANFIKGFELTEGQSIEWRPEEVVSPLPNEISYVRILRVPQIDLAHWSVARGGWAASLSPTILQKRIDAKAALLEGYKQKIATNWLLLVVNTTKPSQLFIAPSNPDELKVESPFSKTFLYFFPEGHIYDL